MRITAAREATVRDVDDGDVVTQEDGTRLVIDEIRRKAGKVEILCVREENPNVSRRTTLSFDSPDAKLTIEAGPKDAVNIIALIAGGDIEWRLDSNGNAAAGVKVNDCAWKITLEA